MSMQSCVVCNHNAEEHICSSCAAKASSFKALKEEDVKWIVNNNGELGVEIHGQCFFLYKGESIQYDESVPSMTYRMVGKREFGECCHSTRMDEFAHHPWFPMPGPTKE